MRRARVRVRVHRDGVDAEASRGARDAAGNLAAVRDEQLREHAISSWPRPAGVFRGMRRCPRALRAKRGHPRCISRWPRAARRPSALRRRRPAGASWRRAPRDSPRAAQRRSNRRSHPGHRRYVNFVHEAELARARGAELLGGEHVARRVARAHGAHQVRRNRRGNDAELHLREDEARGIDRDDDVAGGRESDAAAERVALHSRDHGLR